ncbi:methylated-DNA--[protein]-cysteine S-methyltransferase [Solirubrobacter ginsenosidimutans]|uniref:Methylated-DNA--protein-cysteine methyltransferase n=1 Tax=Solirubrobacter ginsenosidimutans TaxID=490573 RepID=A0A9X3MRZ4_9ACTN|nr:methylated-DNA--[protein]-cysteine S-methyltransferase [Solirubrobacter ginsenosidimutans]MDA0161499.1 methylated-DNA--[protein]-cysteine S-methyltransferase [Solirubrobacter ginsenosidimutans]
MHSALLPSPIGPLYVEADEHGLTKLYTDGHRLHADAGPDDGTFAEVAKQLDEYWAGERDAFDLPLSEHGTPFELAVWARLREIPKGETTTYGEIARELSSVARAVGRANGRNQISIIVPCHRVIGADGSLTGYAGGLDAKRALLEHEQGVGSLYGVPQPR